MKKNILLSSVLSLLALTFIGCGSPYDDNQSDEITLPYDKTVFTYSISDAIEDSKAFVQSSIQDDYLAGREAFAEPKENDKWQGFIGGIWNVPSNIYGTDLDAARNSLVINTEHLGNLQNMVFHRDEDNHIRKGVFQYKGHLYYVLDKGNYVVLSSEDDLDHICVDQEDYINTDDFSNFKIWVWDKDAIGEFYRDGNLGYAYTLRNIKMLDGSYATVTLSGFNYYNYGFRVWIHGTNGKTVKKPYPNQPENEYHRTTDKKLQNFIKSENFDFIYEVENKTDKKLTVQNYLRNVTVRNSDRGIITQTEPVVIEAGNSHQFKYNLAELKNEWPEINSTYLGCFFTPEGKWECRGWENNLIQSGKIHKVIVYPSEEYCMDGINKWEYIDSDFDEKPFTQLSLAKHKAELTGVEYVEILRKEAGESNGWSSIMNYFNSGKQINTDVIIKDYYAEEGKTYEYKISCWNSADNERKYISLGTFEAKAGLGELVINPGSATYNNATKSLEFSVLPTYEPAITIGNDIQLCIWYCFKNSGDYMYFYDFRIKNNTISLSDALKDSRIEGSIVGDTAKPEVIEYRNGMEISEDGSWLNYHTYYNFTNDENIYSVITIN